jgi:cell division protein FtsW
VSAIRAIRLPQSELHVDEGRGTDLFVLVPTLLLVAFGIAMVFSASIPMAAVDRTEDIFRYLKRELLFAALGIAAMWGVSRIPMDRIQRWAGTILFAAVFFLVLVLFVGVRANGALSWLLIPGTSLRFQPSEFAKIALIVAAARYFAKFPLGIPNWRRAGMPFLMLGATAALIAVEPDLGTAAVLVAAAMAYFHIAGAKLSHVLGASAIGLVGASVMAYRHPYIIDRWVAWLHRADLQHEAGYQATQSLIALGSGGIRGLGYCGSVWKYFYLPAAITDSILAVIGEELGLVATWSIIALFLILVVRGMMIAARASDRFSGLVACGVTCLLGVQAVVNIAVATDCMPPTGVPLPFVSYGGSSLLFSLIGIGLLLNVSRNGITESRSETVS